MAGQSTWGNAGASTNAYIVNPQLSKDIYYRSTYRTLFGKLNGRREVVAQKIMYNDREVTIDAGNDSPVWEKNFVSGNEVRFTCREENKGMATYGAAPVKAGSYAQYMHSNCWVRQIDSPAYPIVDSESEFQVADVINDLVSLEKDNISMWRSKEVDLDAFRSLFMGASRGLLLTTDGGLGITLPGGSAGAQRSCYNTFIEGDSSFLTPDATLATHETNVYNGLVRLADDDKYAFTYESHKRNLHLIESVGLKSTSVGGREYIAVALIDQRNIDRMMAVNGTLSALFQLAEARGKDNPALNSMRTLVLDDVLYIPVKQFEFFRPTCAASVITYGAANTSDPRSSSFSNSSCLCPTIYMGAGALLRGRRKTVWFTVKEGDHSKGQEYCVHYHDGWVRHEWVSKDSRTTMFNDSTFITWNYDPGFGVAYSA